MNIIKCPECNSVDLIIHDTKGCIEDGIIIEEMECLECNHIFVVSAELSEIEIKSE